MLEATNINATKPWYRRFRPWQFSLRTLLVIMAIASGGCWYFLLPKKHDEKLASGYLILQRQYRGVLNTQQGGLGALQRTETNDGYWRIKDLEGRLVVNGNFQKDAEHGWWTAYHPNGRKAAQGKMQFGGRVGLWKVWSADGQLVSEVTYALRPANDRPRLGSESDSGKSMRQGQARFWHANGQLAATGNHAQNERTGRWKEWNDRGELRAAGEYVAGQKHGSWQELSASEKKLQTIDYVNGMPREQFTQYLQKLTARLEQGDVSQQITLLNIATNLGQPALPLLEKWALDRTDADVQFAAILGVARCGGSMSRYEAALLELSQEERPHLVTAARWELFRRIPAQRQKLLPLLMKEISQQSNHSPLASIDQLRELFVLEPSQRGAIFAALLTAVVAANESQPPVPLMGPRFTPPELQEWEAAAIPFIDEALRDRDAKIRRAAVSLIRQLLQEKNEFVEDKPPQSFLLTTWRIPPVLVPLIARARADHDTEVKEQADHVDEVYYGGGFGGGGGLF